MWQQERRPRLLQWQILSRGNIKEFNHQNSFGWRYCRMQNPRLFTMSGALLVIKTLSSTENISFFSLFTLSPFFFNKRYDIIVSSCPCSAQPHAPERRRGKFLFKDLCHKPLKGVSKAEYSRRLEPESCLSDFLNNSPFQQKINIFFNPLFCRIL